MSGRPISASNLALALAVLVTGARTAAAQPADPDAPTSGEVAPPVEPPPESAPPPANPEDVGAAPSPAEPPAEPSPEVVEPPAEVAEPASPSPQPEAPARSPEPSTTPPTQTPTRAVPPPPASPPAAPPASTSASADTSAPPPASPAPVEKPAKRGKVRENVKERTEADKRQRFRHGGFILDARIGGHGCMRTTCQGSAGHRAAMGLHVGGFVGFNLFGLIELGLEGGWNTLRPRDVAGRNAMQLYGLDPAQLQEAVEQAVIGGRDLPIPQIDFSGLDVTSATSRAFDIGPSLRIHLIRKGRGLLFVGAGVHYQLWRNRYGTQSGDLRLDMHGASLPLRVGAGAFLTRNLALMGEVSYAPAIFGAMSFRRGDDRGVAPLKVIEDTTGTKFSNKLPHFWSFALTVRFRL